MFFERVVSDLYSQHDGLCIGETHHVATANFIRDRLDFFSKIGIRTFYTEVVASKNNYALERYYNDPSPENLAILKSRIIGGVAKDNAWLKTIVEAQRLGIRVVGIDKQPRKKFRDPVTKRLTAYGPEGTADSNTHWANIVKEDRAKNPDGKYIVHGGDAHMNFVAYRLCDFFNDPTRNTPSADTVPSLLGLPSIALELDPGMLHRANRRVVCLTTVNPAICAMRVVIGRAYRSAIDPLKGAATPRRRKIFQPTAEPVTFAPSG